MQTLSIVEDCPGDTSCAAFPTRGDRIAMAQAAFNEYGEADGTEFADFLLDVLAFGRSEFELSDAWLKAAWEQVKREEKESSES